MKQNKLIFFLSAAGVIVLISFILWLLWPYYVVSNLSHVEPKGEQPSRRACDRIVAIGPRAIPAIIHSLKRNGPFTRRHCYLPVAMGELGNPAHQALLEAIDSEKTQAQRAYLIYALQEAFNDLSHFPLWLEDAISDKASKLQLWHFSSDIRGTFPDATPLCIDEKINSDFLKWWKLNKPENLQAVKNRTIP